MDRALWSMVACSTEQAIRIWYVCVMALLARKGMKGFPGRPGPFWKESPAENKIWNIPADAVIGQNHGLNVTSWTQR